MRSIAKKTLFFLVSGGIGLFLAACYGPFLFVKSFRVRVLDSRSTPVPGLRISGAEVAGSSTTDALGEASLAFYPRAPGIPATIDVADVDGPLNGTHADASFTVDPDLGAATVKLAD